MIETNFKHTDIGPIPHDWEVKRLGDIMDIKSGDSITGDSFLINGKFPVYGGNGIRGHVNQWNICGRYILIGRVGALCGNIHITSGKAFASEHALVCHPNCKYNADFLSPILRGMNLGQYSGASAQPVLAAGKLSKLQICFPPVEEQEAIGKALSDIDGLIDVLRKLIEKKRNIKQGAMSRLLSGSLRLPGFNKPWKTNLLSDVASYGNVPLPSDMFDAKNYVCTENMISNRGGIIPYDDYVCSYMVKSYVPYDILISNIRPYLKKIWFADCSGGVSADVLVVRSNYDIINAKFLYTILSHDKFFSYNMEGIAGTKMPRGNKRHIMNYEFIMPTDLAEQEAIAKVLTDMDSEIENLEKKLAKYEQVKQGMMKQLLTGKIRLI